MVCVTVSHLILNYVWSLGSIGCIEDLEHRLIKYTAFCTVYSLLEVHYISRGKMLVTGQKLKTLSSGLILAYYS